MRATLKQYRQSPQKVRLLANVIRGKRVDTALAALSFTPKRAAAPLAKLIHSAVANAKQANPHVSEQDMRVETITVDEGATLFRMMPRARGRATRIRKRTSHVTLALAPLEKAETQDARDESHAEATR